MTAAGHADLVNGFAGDYFSDTINIAGILGTIDGDVTPAGDQRRLQQRRSDLDSFMGPTISCDHSAWPGQSACGNKVLLYQVHDGRHAEGDHARLHRHVEVHRAARLRPRRLSD